MQRIPALFNNQVLRPAVLIKKVMWINLSGQAVSAPTGTVILVNETGTRAVIFNAAVRISPKQYRILGV